MVVTLLFCIFSALRGNGTLISKDLICGRHIMKEIKGPNNLLDEGCKVDSDS